jgi:hypothetical protein
MTFTPRDVEWGVAEPRPADIAIFSHSPEGTADFNGHAALVIEDLGGTPDRFRTVEGNTSSGSGSQWNGGEVAIKVRHGGIKGFALMGFVRPG